MISEIQSILDLYDEGLESLRRGWNVARSFDAHYWDAELLGRQADLLRESGGATDRRCLSMLRKASGIADRQGAKSLRLRLAIQILSVSGSDASRKAARMDLASVYRSFEEGFDAPELREAAGLIEGR